MRSIYTVLLSFVGLKSHSKEPFWSIDHISSIFMSLSRRIRQVTLAFTFFPFGQTPLHLVFGFVRESLNLHIHIPAKG